MTRSTPASRIRRRPRPGPRAATARGCSRRRRRARAGKSACATVSRLTRESQRPDEDLGLEMFDRVPNGRPKGLTALWRPSHAVHPCLILSLAVSRSQEAVVSLSRPSAIPRSALTTMAASRRSVLRGLALSGLAVGSANLLAACGGDDSGGVGAGGAREASASTRPRAPVPPTTGSRRMADAYAKESGTKVDAQRRRPQHVPGEHQHLPPGHARTTSSPGSPATGWPQFAENGLITDLSDVWPIDGLDDSFKEAATAPDGKQYFVPVSYYPWAVFYRKSVFEKNGWAAADDQRRLHGADGRHAGQGHHAVRLRRQGRVARRWAPSTSSTCGSTASTST